jgi:7-alpha-hydroxysteroid dehydrogenase
MTENPFSLAGQVAIVTASTRGIGRAIAEQFVTSGAAVVVNGRDAETVNETVAALQEMGGRAKGVTGDALQVGLAGELVDAAIESFGKLTIVINNVGYGKYGSSLKEISEEDFRFLFDINVVANWRLAAEAAKRMTEGNIVYISSSAARMHGMPMMGAYAASKAALNNLTWTMARELAPKIRVNAIAPGPIPTDLFKHATGAHTPEDLEQFKDFLGVPLGRFGTPQDIAYAAQYLCSPAASWITGEVINISGGQG